MDCETRVYTLLKLRKLLFIIINYSVIHRRGFNLYVILHFHKSFINTSPSERCLRNKHACYYGTSEYPCRVVYIPIMKISLKGIQFKIVTSHGAHLCICSLRR